MKSLNEVLKYWINPEEENKPLGYLNGEEKTNFLVERIKDYVKINDNILELGCNVGRNLNGLFQTGYRNLAGIEINNEALILMKKMYPDMAKYTERIQGTIHEELIFLDLRKIKFGLIYTMAVLCHIHPDEENIIFDIMSEMTDIIITIEDEFKISDRHCPRNYKEVFESRGMKEVESRNCSGIKGFGKHYIYRRFQK